MHHLYTVGRSITHARTAATNHRRPIDAALLSRDSSFLTPSEQHDIFRSHALRRVRGHMIECTADTRVVVFITTASVYNLGHGLPHYRLNSIISYMVGTPYLPSGLLQCLRRLIYPRSVQGTVKCTSASGLCNSSQFLQCW